MVDFPRQATSGLRAKEKLRLRFGPRFTELARKHRGNPRAAWEELMRTANSEDQQLILGSRSVLWEMLLERIGD